MNVYGTITGTLSTPIRITGTLTGESKITGTLTIPSAILPPAYEGGYSFTPSDETQVAEVKEKWLTENITIEPIPSNYGLITYNGISITVS